MAQYTPGPDGVTYVYFWVRILSAAGVAAAATASTGAVAQPFMDVIIWSNLGGVSEGSSVRATAAQGALPGAAEVGHYAFHSSYDRASNKVDIRQMPPGTTQAQAAAWINTDEGKTWAKGAFVFMGHTSFQTG